ncbi:hypothetical protein MP638_006726 [Amoeboaphelidium occidentale]|nr:hypothetical protein MP638_006726 [Amoeboaphelidium occidentale]
MAANQIPAAGNVMPVTTVLQSLPQSYPFEDSRFYVRECYEEYYTYIIHALNQGIKVITLTGTPGIGKSVFYIREHPDKEIVTASFTKKSVLGKCVVFAPGQVEGHDHGEKLPLTTNAIHLYDGPPSVAPQGNFMIAFTSPNYDWLEEIAKYRKSIMYMPFWTLDELLNANVKLELGLKEEEDIEVRYKFVGGSARICLQVNQDEVDEYCQSLSLAIQNMDSFEKVKTYLQFDPTTQKMSHKLFFYTPIMSKHSNTPRKWKLSFCSVQVGLLVHAKIKEKSKTRRDELIGWLRGFSESSSFIGWVFEGYCKEELLKGGTLQLIPLFRPLHNPLNSEELLKGGTFQLIPLFRPLHNPLNSGSSQIQIPEGSYVHPNIKNFESIDGYYYNERQKKLYLFQITRSNNHPVNGAGIIKFVQSMGLAGDNEVKICIVFVIPKDLTNFKVQNIIKLPVLKDNNSVSDIRGIGPAGTKELNDNSIFTVLELKRAIDSGNNVALKYSRHLRNVLEIENHNGLLDTIDQDLLVTEGEFKEDRLKYNNNMIRKEV